MNDSDIDLRVLRLENELGTYKSANILLKKTLDEVRKMVNESVKIDKYVIKDEKTPKIIIFDNELQRNIVSVNTLVAEFNLALAGIILDELNTGKYEVDDDGES